MPSRFGGLAFRFKAPASYGEFLELSLMNQQPDAKLFPSVMIAGDQVAPAADGWTEAFVPWTLLDPYQSPFDRVMLKAKRFVGSDWVLIDKMVLTRPNDSDAGSRPPPVRESELSIDCDKPASPISPLIYGISHATEGAGETANRIGGNAMTRLNWDLGVWNTGSDWFFENTKGKDGIWDWIDDAYRRGVKMAVVVPMIGWVAKDATSVGFPSSMFANQRGHDPQRPEAGDGMRSDGTPMQPGAPATTSIPAPPELIGRWITALRAKDKERGGRGASMYILDNEPNLWHGTHRDVHPTPLTYDELLDRTIKYGRAIRDADPDAVIAGPAEWGWSAYFFSAKDSTSTWMLSPDRRAHGGIPLLPWYLERLASYEKRTGVRILDVVDLHFYPQAPGVYGNGARTDPETSALRLRSTRALWDPEYRDESWIKEHVNLLPRLKDWIKQNYPGRGISIGEWSFGAEEHISGGLAVAEVLGRFGQQGITSAFYWGTVASSSAAQRGFRAYRNFDGKGGRFLDLSVPTHEAQGISLFASRDESSRHVVAILVNTDPVFATSARIAMPGCGVIKTRRVFRYGAGSSDLVEQPSAAKEGDPLVAEVPPWSLGVIDLQLQPGSP
jgi:hypothetical protein